MTRNERTLRDAKTSISEIVRLLNSIYHPNKDDISSLLTCANQAAQAAKEINMLVGALIGEHFQN